MELLPRQFGLKAAVFILTLLFTANLVGPIYQTLSDAAVHTEWQDICDSESEKPEKSGEELDDKVRTSYDYRTQLSLYKELDGSYYQAPRSVFHPPIVSPPPEA